jgi:aminoglycoside phosphotransferase (APT) family kinase protein
VRDDVSRIDATWLTERLTGWAAEHVGPGARVDEVRAMPGHAGLSFGFTVTSATGDVDRLVMRMPPKGVRRAGNTDVLRQVPLLQALAAHGAPVAPMRWWSDDERWFDVPFFMVGLLPGTTFVMRDRDARFAAGDGVVRSVFEQAVRALASCHSIDWQRDLAGWEPVKDLRTEITFWDPILAKAAEPHWRTMGERVRDLLLDRLPTQPRVGLFHGDFQTNNVLFDADASGRPQLVAVLDWEISGLGAQLLDLGWLLMMNDPESWDPAGASALAEVPPFDDIVATYEDASGRGVDAAEVRFHRALSGFRFGAISGLNVMLHRTGKRPDEEWERIALSVPYLFGRAEELLLAG